MMAMATLAFDTHAAVKRLQNAGADERLAEAVVATCGSMLNENVATKSDIADLRATTKSDIVELRADLKNDLVELRATTKSDIAELRARVDSVADAIQTNRWISTIGFTVIAIVLTVSTFLR